MASKKLLGGKNEISLGNVLFPAEILGDINITYEEGIMEAETQAGTRKQPSGKAETAEIVFTLFVEDFDDVKKAFDVAEADPLVFGGGDCVSTQTPRAINIHPVCNGNDAKDDIHVYGGLINTTFSPTLSTGDALQIELTIQMQPTVDGYMLVGYPDPNTPTYWDVETQTYKPVE